MLNLQKIIGLAGVSHNEYYLARRWSHIFEFGMVLIAIWLPLQWYLERHTQISLVITQWSNWLVWLFFVSETTTLLYLVKAKPVYLKTNWMNLMIIILGFPLVWQHESFFIFLRSLQLLLILRLTLPWWNTSVHFFSRNRLSSTLFAGFVTTTLAGVLMAVFDQAYKTPWDGIWWAWQTITTVGYGDIVPSSIEGRLLAVFMMLMGLAFLSLLTANFSAYFISKGSEKTEKKEDKILNMLNHIQTRIDKIEQEIQKIQR